MREKIRNILGCFLFSGEDIDKQAKILSGGEKSRLAICKMLVQPYNTLILDEPTNHLDIQVKKILKKALQSFDGTMIIVSHDRDFLTDLVDKVYEIKDGEIHEFNGDITDYLTQKKELENKNINLQEPKKKSKSDNPKIQKTKTEIKELNKQITKIERNISQLEKELKTIEQDIAKNNDDSEIFNQYKEKQDKLNSLLEKWATLEDKKNE